MDDKRLDRQQSYHRFHLGVYITLCTAITGASAVVAKQMISIPGGPGMLLLILFFLILSAGCGGMVAAKIPEAKDYDLFLRERIGFSFPLSAKIYLAAKPKTWEAFEHLFFWIAVLIYPAILIFIYFSRPVGAL
jgi:hypothetical protein